MYSKVKRCDVDNVIGDQSAIIHMPTMTFICLFRPVCNRRPREILCSSPNHKICHQRFPSIAAMFCPYVTSDWTEWRSFWTESAKLGAAIPNKKIETFQFSLCRSLQKHAWNAYQSFILPKCVLRSCLKCSCILGSNYIRSPCSRA